MKVRIWHLQNKPLATPLNVDDEVDRALAVVWDTKTEEAEVAVQNPFQNIHGFIQVYTTNPTQTLVFAWVASPFKMPESKQGHA